MEENPGTQKKPDNDNQDKEKKSPYKFKSETFSMDDKAYFERLKNAYERSKQAKKKVEPERQDIKRHIQSLKQKLKKCTDEKKRDLLSKDLSFFQSCLPAMKMVEGMIDQGLATAKRILESGVKQPYRLVVDFKRMPCPSERMFGKDKDKKKKKGKDKDKDKDKDQNKKPGDEKDKAPKRNKKETMDKIKEMRGLSKDTPIAPLKDTGFIKAGEKINVEGIKLAPEFAAAPKDGKAAEGEGKEAAAATPGSKKNRKKSLAEYKKQYGFTRAVQRKGVSRPMQNINSLAAAGKSGGR